MSACRIRFVLLAGVLGLTALAAAQTQPVLLGVLEDTPGHSVGDPHYRDVRVVFHRAAKRWEAFPSSCPDEVCLQSVTSKFPAEVHWTIAFDGRNLGNITARTPSAFDFFSAVGQQQIIGDVPPPTIGKPSAEFGGFRGEAVYRPLVAVSQPNYRDPDGWKPAHIPDELLIAARTAFRQKFPKVENCSRSRPGEPVPWRYPGANIKLQKAYGSIRNWFLVEVTLTGNLCDGPPDDAFQPQWFVITPQREVRWLDSEMWLVDAGDYDNDGKSELVFAIDAYDRGGYKLFYDDFRQSASFEFSYH